jgi:glycosyltransferase involved in cell wall biosynthesis
LEGFRKTWQDQTVLPQIYTATVSRMLKDALVDGGYPADRIEVTPMFTTRNEAPFAPPPEDDVPRFLYLGALLEQKGIGVLLEAVANARRPVHLDIAGTGPYKKVLQERIDTLGIRERVTFHGWVNAAARTELLAGARALVVPSIAPETAGAVAVEAAAQGRAVIASAIGGLPEYARHGETAIVVPPGDEEALAIALDQLAGDWSLAAQLGRCGYDVAQEVFTIDYHLQQLYDLYHRSIQEQVGSGTAQQSIKPSFS